MTRNELSALIDKVVGSKGIMRASVWWVKRLLNKMLDYCESLTPNIEIKTEAQVNDSANPVQSKAVKEYVDAKLGEVGEFLDLINGEEI